MYRYPKLSELLQNGRVQVQPKPDYTAGWLGYFWLYIDLNECHSGREGVRDKGSRGYQMWCSLQIYLL